MLLSTISDSVKELWDRLFTRQQDHRFWRYLPQALMGLGFVIMTTLMFPQSQSVQFSHLNEGDVYIGEEIIAPFKFLINKSDEEYERDKTNAMEKIPWVYNYVDSVSHSSLERLKKFFQSIDAIRESVSPDSIKQRRLQDVLNDHFVIMEEDNKFLLLSTENLEIKETKNNKSEPDEPFQYEILKKDLLRILADTYSIGILNTARDEVPDYVTRISIVRNGQETEEKFDDFYNVGNLDNVILEDKLRQTYPDQDVSLKIGYLIITQFLQSNTLYDAEETENRINRAISRVPLAKGTVLAKERIVDQHERITRDILEKLNSLALAKAEKEFREGGGWRLILSYVGKILMICLAVSFTVIFLYTSRKNIFNNYKEMLMIFFILVVIIGVTFLVNQIGFSKYKFLIPISIASMLLTIFFDTRTAFIGTVTLSLLIGALRGNEFGIMLVSLFVGTISIFSVREIQARSWILRGIVFITGSYLVSITALQFLRSQDLMIRDDYLFATFNGAMSPILTYGLMIIFEYVFKLTTDSTLLELSDLNKPLLRQLAIRAPGTYHHSIMVGNISEAAAEAIGANALLARVGSYYHDIGKMDMPEYFVENQKGGKNPHEKLTPNMSCLILINHVKRGLEIAEEYDLPKVIRDFIPQHHGTNLIGFFYNKARENCNGAEINESDFRYPGPKPQTKEAGIVMLADAVEAVLRTLKEPTVSRMRSLVNTFIEERLSDSEFDQCPLTIQDLNVIRESFVNNLTGMFHGRIEYPDKKMKLFRRTDRTR
ncbi:MAG: HD family phosphohydrolase [bacterium]